MQQILLFKRQKSENLKHMTLQNSTDQNSRLLQLYAHIVKCVYNHPRASEISSSCVLCSGCPFSAGFILYCWTSWATWFSWFGDGQSRLSLLERHPATYFVSIKIIKKNILLKGAYQSQDLDYYNSNSSIRGFHDVKRLCYNTHIEHPFCWGRSGM